MWSRFGQPLTAPDELVTEEGQVGRRPRQHSEAPGEGRPENLPGGMRRAHPGTVARSGET